MGYRFEKATGAGQASERQVREWGVPSPDGPWPLVLQSTENPIYVAVAVGNQRGRYFRLDRGLKLKDEPCRDKVEIVVAELQRWPGALTRVDLFLRQSGLGDPQRPETGYGDLLELLETRYLNPLAISGSSRPGRTSRPIPVP